MGRTRHRIWRGIGPPTSELPMALAYEWPRGQGLARGTTIWGSGTNYHQHPSCQQLGGGCSVAQVASCYPTIQHTHQGQAGRPQTRGQGGHVGEESVRGLEQGAGSSAASHPLALCRGRQDGVPTPHPLSILRSALQKAARCLRARPLAWLMRLNNTPPKSGPWAVE